MLTSGRTTRHIYRGVSGATGLGLRSRYHVLLLSAGSCRAVLALHGTGAAFWRFPLTGPFPLLRPPAVPQVNGADAQHYGSPD